MNEFKLLDCKTAMPEVAKAIAKLGFRISAKDGLLIRRFVFNFVSIEVFFFFASKLSNLIVTTFGGRSVALPADFLMMRIETF